MAMQLWQYGLAPRALRGPAYTLGRDRHSRQPDAAGPVELLAARSGAPSPSSGSALEGSLPSSDTALPSISGRAAASALASELVVRFKSARQEVFRTIPRPPPPPDSSASGGDTGGDGAGGGGGGAASGGGSERKSKGSRPPGPRP